MIDPFAWLALVGLPGHVSWMLWVGNMLHARPIDWRRQKPISHALNLCLLAAGLLLAGWALVRLAGESGSALPAVLAWLDRPLSLAGRLYVAACVVNTVVGFVPWLVRRLTRRDCELLLADEVRYLDLRTELKGPLVLRSRTKPFTAIPYNQTLHLAVHTKRLRVPTLPAALGGLRIAHLSDLHITGQFDRRLYDYFAELTQSLEPDVVAFTGDLVEKEPCWDWLAETFAKFRVPHGAYFVLGNHDIRIDHERTREILSGAGLVDLGTRSHTANIRGVDVLFSGNELPWLGPPPRPPQRSPADDLFRILLSHSPDQLPFARTHEFDLMLAGHVHGGQIQIPPVGPILAPSRHGVHYASGVFHEPPTVLHVGRGTSCKVPLRFFCPPELTLLVLEPPAGSGQA